MTPSDVRTRGSTSPSRHGTRSPMCRTPRRLAHELQRIPPTRHRRRSPMAVHPERFEHRRKRTPLVRYRARLRHSPPHHQRRLNPRQRHAGGDAAAPATRGLALSHVACCVCGAEDCVPVGIGEDFEYRTSPDTFIAMRCRSCGLIYLDPRPAPTELPRIYPPNYHAFDFSPERFGFVYRVRRWLEARRALQWCRGLTANAADPRCRMRRRFPSPAPARLRPARMDARRRRRQRPRRRRRPAARASPSITAPSSGSSCPPASYDLVLLIATIEHVDDPAGVLRAVRRLLKPGGRAVIVTDNTATLDFAVFGGRHWGGYHFPRHFNLFNRATLERLGAIAALEVESVETVDEPGELGLLAAQHARRLGRAVVDRRTVQSPVASRARGLHARRHRAPDRRVRRAAPCRALAVPQPARLPPRPLQPAALRHG